MYPISPTGRILACICAFVGAGMMGMLVSVLVGRYQRVYNRKMYIPEPEVSTADLEQRLNSQDNTKSNHSSRRSSLKRPLPSAIPDRLPSVHGNSRPNQRRSSSRSSKAHSIVSFDGENIDDNQTDKLVLAVKAKLTEVEPDHGTGINLKSIKKQTGQIWATCASHLPLNLLSNPTTTTSNNEDMKLSRSQAF
jgi:hypothetical protein